MARIKNRIKYWDNQEKKYSAKDKPSKAVMAKGNKERLEKKLNKK